MNLERLISNIVRQTTVLIARLSTAGGVRSPLARVADQVFVGLVSELERQGVGKKVAADMFGLALRSYQLKVQRLQESASQGGTTLWAAVRDFVEERGPVTRANILARFARDDEASVGGILNDLVESGLVYRAGRGAESVFRAMSRDELAALAGGDSDGARAALVWLAVCRDGPLGLEAAAQSTGLGLEDVGAAIARLVDAGRVRREASTAGEVFSADHCLIPLGDDAGFEAALLDHHQTVLNAIAAKVASGARASSADDAIGGSTYSFELWPGHPEESAVVGLLKRLRAEVASVWDRTRAHNALAARAENGRYNVSFYLGQWVRRDDEEKQAK
jgi:hypothetical protein